MAIEVHLVDHTTDPVRSLYTAYRVCYSAFTPAQIEVFKKTGAQAVVGFSHPNYSHMSVLPENVRAALAADFD